MAVPPRPQGGHSRDGAARFARVISGRDCYTCLMCIICIDLAKGVLTGPEARRALGEMHVKLDRDHVREIQTKIAEAEKAKPDKP
jgi:hypothetical protein